MDVLGRVPAGFPDDESVALFVPFENGAWTDAEPLTNPGGNGNLALCRQSGTCKSHI